MFDSVNAVEAVLDHLELPQQTEAYLSHYSLPPENGFNQAIACKDISSSSALSVHL